MSPIIIDCETELIQPGNQTPRLVCVSIAHEQKTTLVHWSDPLLSKLLYGILTSGSVIVGHHITYDMRVIARAFPDLLQYILVAYSEDRVTDTKLRAQLIDNALGVLNKFEVIDGKNTKLTYSLDALSKRFLKRKLDKNTWRLRYGELRDVPLEQWPQAARDYPIEDAKATSDLYHIQEGVPDLLVDQYRQARAGWWIGSMSARGIMTDRDSVSVVRQKAEQEYYDVAAHLLAAGLIRDKKGGGYTRCTKKAKERMTEMWPTHLGEVPLTAKEQVSLAGEHCKATGDPDLIRYAEFAELIKTMSTDVPMLEAGCDVPIHSWFHVIKATGRTSSTRPNLQNIRRKLGIRECFVPREGYVFASADYDGFELRTVAQCCKTLFGHSRLGDRLNEGLDPHLEIAAMILRVSYDEAKARYKAGDDAADDARQTGKVANFGFPGGLGVTSFVAFADKGYGVKLTEDQARDLKKFWLAAWPEFQDYFRWIDLQCRGPEGRATITQLFSNRYRGQCKYTEACNTLFQGLAADAAKHAGFLIQAKTLDTTSPLYGSHIVNFVHDEFILEVPEPLAHEAATELAATMVEGAAPWLPDVPPKASACLMRRWYKAAKPVFENGRLIPWEPC